MQRHYRVSRLKFMFKHIKRFEWRRQWLRVVIGLAAMSFAHGQWTSEDVADKDSYNGGSAYQKGVSSLPIINPTVRNVNSFNLLELEQMNRDNIKTPNRGYSSSYGSKSTYNGENTYEGGYNGDYRPINDYGSSYNGGNRDGSLFYGNNNNNNGNCYEGNAANCASQSGALGYGKSVGFGSSGQMMGATVLQPVLPNEESQGVDHEILYGDASKMNGVGSRIAIGQNGGYSGRYTDGFINNNQVIENNNNGDYYDIPNDFNGNNNININNNIINTIDDIGFNAQNMRKYAEYLELINQKYGIGMPGTPSVNKGGLTGTVANTKGEQVDMSPPYKSNVDGVDGGHDMLPRTMTNGGSGNSGYGNREPTVGEDGGLSANSVGYVTSDGCEKQSLSPDTNNIGGINSASNGYSSLHSIAPYTGTGRGNYQSQSPYGNSDATSWRRACPYSSSAENNIISNNNFNANYGNGNNGNAIVEQVSEQMPPPPPPPPTTRPVLSPSSVQALTQQIRRLPSVFYLHSTDAEAVELEQLLRKTYGLPLVVFYVDKMEQPQTIERNLEQLTAFAKMPYLFICGTFIGSKEHIDNYHRNKQIPQLVQFVCAEKKTTVSKRRRKKKRLEKSKRRRTRLL